jgi:hypothetical protein
LGPEQAQIKEFLMLDSELRLADGYEGRVFRTVYLHRFCVLHLLNFSLVSCDEGNLLYQQALLMNNRSDSWNICRGSTLGWYFQVLLRPEQHQIIDFVMKTEYGSSLHHLNDIHDTHSLVS